MCDSRVISWRQNISTAFSRKINVLCLFLFNYDVNVKKKWCYWKYLWVVVFFSFFYVPMEQLIVIERLSSLVLFFSKTKLLLIWLYVKMHNEGNLRRELFILAHSLWTQRFIEGKVCWQEHEAAACISFTLKKKRDLCYCSVHLPFLIQSGALACKMVNSTNNWVNLPQLSQLRNWSNMWFYNLLNLAT